MKKTIRKCKRNGEDVHLALLAIRSTPRKSQLYSPGEILMKRKLRTNLPSLQKASSPNAKFTRNNAKQNYDGIELPKLRIGDTVRIYDHKSWSRQGTVIQKHNSPRSYNVRTNKGTVIRRNRKDLLKVQNNHNHSEFDTDDSYPDITEEEEEMNIINPEVIREDNDPSIIHTRSGRQVRRPSYLNDYET